MLILRLLVENHAIDEYCEIGRDSKRKRLYDQV